jgi:hypothetical protein
MQNDEFELILLPAGCLPGGQYSELYEQVYDAWKKTWIEVFTEVGSPEAFNSDSFFRAHLVPVILHKGQIAAFYVANVYSLQSSWLRDHSYFSIFSEEARENLRSHGVRNVMSYEFMTVLPHWRKSSTGFSLAGLLAELGLRVRDDLACDAAVGVARLENKVNEIARCVGAFTLDKNARRGNLVCEIVGLLKATDRPFPDARVHNLCVHLWNRRVQVNKFGNNTSTTAIRIAA